MIPAVVGYTLMAGFFSLEILARRPNRARSFKAGPATRGTAVLLGLANTTSTLFSPAQLPPHWSRLLGRADRPIGHRIDGAGLGLRLWAMLTLGPFYTRT
jgi:hypothetical protein